jgi:hypothetical protein
MRSIFFGLLAATALVGTASAAGLDRPQYWPQPGNPDGAIGAPDVTTAQMPLPSWSQQAPGTQNTVNPPAWALDNDNH